MKIMEGDSKNTKVKPAQVSYETQVEIPDDESTAFSWRKLWRFTGPGFLMSIAYLDPGNIESDLQAGSIVRYRLIWVLLMAHILGLLLQRLAARLGVVTGKHMAEIAHSYYPKYPRIILWIMVELAIIGSDMQEVIGTAISFYLLSNTAIPLWAGVLITITDTFTFLFLEKFGVRKFEFFFCFLISIMAISFGYEFVETAPPAGPLFTGMFLPWCKDCSSDQLMQGVAIIGAVVMPHNFYLHSALVKSRTVDRRRRERVTEANMYYFIESAFALFCSFWINLLVMSVFADGLYGKTNNDVYLTCNTNNNHMPNFYKNVFTTDNQTAQSDIYHAGIYLGCTFGVAALYIWAVGILAAGQSSTMTGTYAGQFAMEGFIQIKLKTWQRVLVTRSLAIAPTLLVTIFSGGIDNISSLNDTLNCIQMVQLPFALIPVLTFVSDAKVMGEYKCSRFQKGFSVIVSLLIILINFYFLYDWIGDTFGWSPVSIPITAVLGVLYVIGIVYMLYYCLVSMGIISPFEDTSSGWKTQFAPPIYEHFDLPWEDDYEEPKSIDNPWDSDQKEVEQDHL